MRVLLISANTERLNMPMIPLGLGFVAAAARRAGHDVEFLDLMFKKSPQAALQNRIGVFNPEVIGIYPGTQLAKRALTEGMITSEDELLTPHFYLAPDVDPWIRQVVTAGFRSKE